jgi:hypothetical protein
MDGVDRIPCSLPATNLSIDPSPFDGSGIGQQRPSPRGFEALGGRRLPPRDTGAMPGGASPRLYRAGQRSAARAAVLAIDHLQQDPPVLARGRPVGS